MTLNITILTPQIIYQSADYALFDEHAKKPLPMPSTKAVVVSNFEWTAFITYTGLGRVGNKHTFDYIHDWIQKLDNQNFEDLVEIIRDRASRWVHSVRYGKEHTFVVAAFVRGVSTAAIVSNFRKWHGAKLPTLNRNFTVSTVVAKRRAEVIVTGYEATKAVPRSRRRALQRLAEEYSHDGSRMRRALAQATREGAQRYPNYISEDCFVYSQDRDGRGHYEPMGATRTENPMFMGSLEMKDLMRDLADKAFGPGKWSIRGMTSTTGQNQSAPPKRCALERASGYSSIGYRLVELAVPEGRRATPRSINTDGIVVGDGTPQWSGPSYPCFWPEQTRVEFLSHGGGLGGTAHDINDAGLIVGNSEWPDRTSHACTWNLDSSVSDIGEALGSHSGAKAVTASGEIIGWVSIHPTEGGQVHFRPAYWPNSRPPVILGNLAGGWGEAVDISSMGLLLVIVQNEGDITLSGNAGAWLWNGEKVTEIEKPSSDVVSFYPHRFTDDGDVVGLAITKGYHRYGLVKNINGIWSLLFAPAQGREMTAVNRRLLIAGYDLINEYRIPWLKPKGGDIMYLPHYKFHHHQITKVSKQGWAVGTALADNCSHPLLWIPA